VATISTHAALVTVAVLPKRVIGDLWLTVHVNDWILLPLPKVRGDRAIDVVLLDRDISRPSKDIKLRFTTGCR
jgi:hypothetical protein